MKINTKENINEGNLDVSTSTAPPDMTNDKPRDNSDFEKMLGTLKNSHNMLSKLNEVLKKKQDPQSTTIKSM